MSVAGEDPPRGEAAALSLAEQDARLQLLTSSIPALVWSTDAQLRFTSGAGASLAALGLTPGELVGLSLWDYFGTRDPESPHMAGTLAALRGESVSAKVEWAGRIYESHIEPLRDASGAIVGTIGVALDVTDRDHAEREHALLRAKLRHQQRLEAIGTLASGVAHEINNPVQSIMNYAQLIRRRVGEGEVEGYAGEILHEAQRVAAIVRNLRSFARQEGEPYTEVGLADIVSNTLALTGVMLHKEGIELHVEVPTDADAVLCHPQQIQQVLMNLLANARDALNERYPATQDEPSRKVIRICSSTEGDGRVRLTVEDNGVGIAADLLGTIFDPWCTTKPEREGAGLGLPISLAIAREHGGTLTAESEPGAYTRMHLDLPIAAHAHATS